MIASNRIYHDLVVEDRMHGNCGIEDGDVDVRQVRGRSDVRFRSRSQIDVVDAEWCEGALADGVVVEFRRTAIEQYAFPRMRGVRRPDSKHEAPYRHRLL